MTDTTGDPRPRLSKSLRYEILRRDNHTCRYCGASAPDVKLTVDHVMPVTLGGPTEPGNLVAACVDCNAGKKATPPGAPLVEDVKDDALRWARVMQLAAEIHRESAYLRMQDIGMFDCTWREYEVYGEPYSRPSDWETSVNTFLNRGLNGGDLDRAVETAMNSRVDCDNTWRYFCGVAWRMIDERQKIARALYETEDTDGS